MLVIRTLRKPQRSNMSPSRTPAQTATIESEGVSFPSLRSSRITVSANSMRMSGPPLNLSRVVPDTSPVLDREWGALNEASDGSLDRAGVEHLPQDPWRSSWPVRSRSDQKPFLEP